MIRKEKEPIFPGESLHPSFLFLLDHFGVSALGQISWAHRVNTIEAIVKALERGPLFIEGDVRLSPKREPVMNHDPLMSGEEYLSLNHWLREILSLSQT